MGVLIGLAFGSGLVLAAWAWTTPRRAPAPRRPLPIRPVAVVAGAFAVGFAVMLLISGVPVIALAFGLLVAGVPRAVARASAARRARAFAETWPDAVDHLGSAVRAGLSLTEALTQLGERGPQALRPPFAEFGADMQRTGRFDDSLDDLKSRLADPVGDRVVEVLRLARHVGGGDLGRVLRALSGFLRDDQRVRGEVEARQSWTVTGAKLAVAAPWIVLFAMSFQRDVVARYSTPTGVVILLGGAVVCVVAYRLMLRLGQLPQERRVLA